MPLKPFTIVLLLLGCTTARGQLLFSGYSLEDGMSSREVTSACKDRHGFIWFGTSNGLNRYDGSGFKIYNRQQTNCRALTNDYISSIAENKAGIWIGTPTGLFLLDRKTDQIKPISIADNKFPAIHQFEKISENEIWVFTNKGIMIISNEKLITLENYLPNTKGIISYSKYYSSMQDSLRNGIWLCSDVGVYFIHPSSGQVFSKRNNPKKWKIFEVQKPVILAVGAKSKIWYVDTVSYLRQFDIEKNRIFNLKQTGIQYPQTLEMRNAIHNIFTDHNGQLWINGWTGWLMKMESDSKIVPLSDYSIRGYEPGEALYRMFCSDNKKNSWLVSNNGVFQIVDKGFLEGFTQLQPSETIKKNIKYTPINSVTKANASEWWICSEGGLYKYNKTTREQKLLLLQTDNLRAQRFYHTVFFEGEWWFGTGDGIKIYNPSKKTFRPFQHYAKGHEVINRSASHLLVDKKNTLWFSVWADGIYRYSPKTKTTIRFDGSDPRQGNILPYGASSLTLDNSGDVWLTSEILRKFDYSTQQWVKPYLPEYAKLFEQNTVYGAVEDSRGNKWIGVKRRGVFLLNRSGKVVDSINTENGISSDLVYEFFLDKHNRLWLSTSEAVHFVNLSDKNVTTLDIKTQYAFGDYWPVFGSDKDTLAVTFNDIVCFINLDKLGKKLTEDRPLITSISVFEKELPFDFSNPTLDLSYSQNFFTIEYSSPRHNEIRSIQYAYKLEGLNNEWVYCGKRQVASFSNLSNGYYRFLVKSTDANGLWNETASMVVINIKPPFWKTHWFIFVFSIFIGLSVYWIYKTIEKRNRKITLNKTIDYFANSAYGENSIDEICWDIARNCISQMGFEDCVVYLLDEHTGRLIQKAAFGPKNPKGHEITDPIEIEMGQGIVGAVAQSGKPEMINDTRADNRYITDDMTRMSELAVPILHEGKVIGIIDSENSRINFFTTEHLKAISTIASISANKIAEAQAEQVARENEIKLLEINRRLAETKLMALRAQINPHFVFNCLNSIQECIIRQKYGDASNYLNKFSKLFRLVLNNSGKQLVCIAEEKDVLELYLQLEAMRFENQFEYTLGVDKLLDLEDIMMPSMLLQPFVENALWHGLMHKDGARILHISFELKNEHIFRCIIDDNGIGRKQSAAIKSQQGAVTKHDSKGLQITTDRISLLQKQGYHASINIIDKYNNLGAPTGTRVVIELSTEITN